MARFTLLALLVPALSAVAAPLPAKRAFSFALQSYEQFQISSGVAGQAQAEANAVFVDPFPSDLTTVDATSLDNLGTMREAAESAETELFNPQIAAASGATAAALQVGKIKNKVLKLTGEVQQIKIKIAQAAAKGSDTSDLESSLTEEQTKLSNNIALDVAAAGQTSQAAVDAGVVRRAAASSFAGFSLLQYSQFQISDTPGGTAQAEANAVFVDPFPADLTTVDATSLANLGTMREAAEDAETNSFDPEISAASGAAADALQVGKIKNKVLKLTGEVQQIKIKIAQAAAKGSDTSDLESSLTEEQTKLTTNINLDIANKGKTSKGVA